MRVVAFFVHTYHTLIHLSHNVMMSSPTCRLILADARNAVGEKIVRDCAMLEGTKVSLSDVKDEIILEGNDIEKVSQSAASITDKTRVKDKDIRKFLECVPERLKRNLPIFVRRLTICSGVYISERTTVVQEA